MNLRASMLVIAAAGSLVATPACADRGYRHDHFWGPVGFLLGSAILYSAIQPRTVYYAPPVTYAPPAYPVAGVVQPYDVDQVYATAPPISLPPPPQNAARISTLTMPGSQWWYFCKNPEGYYPYVRECPSGWEKVSPVPPGMIRP
ncbi:MAG: hypothetical protein WCV99_00795 [Sterolibacterium sp.]